MRAKVGHHPDQISLPEEELKTAQTAVLPPWRILAIRYLGLEQIGIHRPMRTAEIYRQLHLPHHINKRPNTHTKRTTPNVKLLDTWSRIAGDAS